MGRMVVALDKIKSGARQIEESAGAPADVRRDAALTSS